ncbi:hypothetical protein [Halovenus sp. HT40]|uniref:hypothetical protein n=1 Tax=Halovenus sp. HT40 TaxID=3126691 RepID=UPI00300EFA63
MTTTRHSNGSQVIERWNTVFKALSAEPRRQIIVSLLDTPPDESVPLPESAVNPNVPQDSKSLRRELHHVHLPMLSEMDFVVSKSEPLVASRGPQFDEAATVLETLQTKAADIPDSLVVGCQRLEAERENVR